MADSSIFDFLNVPHKPLIRHLTDHINGGNTTSRSHEWDYTDIRRLEYWDLFSLKTLRIRFGPLFDITTSISTWSFNWNPPYMTRFTRVNIALQSLNVRLNHTPDLLDTFDKVSERQVICTGLQYGAGKPDLTFHLYADQSQLCPIAVGDIKLYAKWSYGRWKSLSLEDLMDFRQVLAQINYYMRKRKCRYAVATTEAKCIAIYRVPGYNGWLKLSDPFPVEWTENIKRDGSEFMTANAALFGLSLWAQWAADAHDEEGEEEEEYAELDSYFPEQPSSLPMPSSLPEFHPPASEYL
ncbi:hypothetical protein IFR05_012548 [Cadophora sp. M221]|nr:hypothetical protein IFR05_012548 [Cadophora sp. M221]